MMNIMGDIFYSWEDIEADLNNPNYCKKWFNNGEYEVGNIVEFVYRDAKVKRIPFFKIKIVIPEKRKIGKIIEIRDLFTTNFTLKLPNGETIIKEKPDFIRKIS